MKVSGKNVLICDCEQTMSLDADALSKFLGPEKPTVHTQLCRSQLDAFTRALTSGEGVLVGCTQEAPIFSEVADETGFELENLSFTNIRERSGWSAEGKSGTPKLAALIAEAALDIPPAGSITMTSEGRVIVLGQNEVALTAARRLSERLDVRLVLTEAKGIAPPPSSEIAIFHGQIRKARGYFGNFELDIEGLAAARPSASAELEFEAGRDTTLNADLLLDLRSGDAMFTAPDKRDGYLKPNPSSPLQIEAALGDLAQMVGEFEKPLYVNYRAGNCAHARSQLIGCTRCLDLCPTGAIKPAGDNVAIDPHICAGCGNCAASCPTDAIVYSLPGESIFLRLRTVLNTYAAAGGLDAVLLVHNNREGEELINSMARHYQGLPAKVIPFALNQVSQIGFEFLLSAAAFGAAKIVILAPPCPAEDLAGLGTQVGYANAVLQGLGYDATRIETTDQRDPEALCDYLYGLVSKTGFPPATFTTMGKKRDLLVLALRHLYEHAPEQHDIIIMPEGAPIGTIEVRETGCTMCLACVSACPVGALGDNPDNPMLRLNEAACVQCGLCRTTCPEKVITLEPRINFSALARDWIVIKEEEPFLCTSCGKPFAVKSTIDRMIEKLGSHAMFVKDPKALTRLKMCENCRVIDMFDDQQPMAGGDRPRLRTTDDEIARRELGEKLEDD